MRALCWKCHHNFSKWSVWSPLRRKTVLSCCSTGYAVCWRCSVSRKSLLSQHVVTRPVWVVNHKWHLPHSWQKVTKLNGAFVQTRRNWTEIATKRPEATYPLPRLLLLGPIFRSPGQRDGVGSERIFERPPLPWRVSRGATGVKTPDNQSGILKSRGQRRYKKTNQNPKSHTHTYTQTGLLFAGNQGQPGERPSVWSWRPTSLQRTAHDWRVDWAAHRLVNVPERVDREWVKLIWG